MVFYLPKPIIHLIQRRLARYNQSMKIDLPLPEGIELLSLVAEGGFGIVAKGRHTKSGQLLALKYLKECDEDMKARFRREARVLAKLHHPNIVEYHGFEEVDGQSIIITEFVEGEDLEKRLSTGRALPLEKIRQLGASLLGALSCAHKENVIHRDLKNANILITEEGELKLTDFGIAAYRDIEGTLTKTGVILGTPTYMAPEQIKGGKIGAHTDIYAAGIILFEMATGQLPFKSENIATLLENHLKSPTPSLRAINGKVPLELEKIVHKCLQKNPRHRYSSALELAEALASCREATKKTVLNKKPQLPTGTKEAKTRRAPLSVLFCLILVSLFYFGTRAPTPEKHTIAKGAVVDSHGLGKYKSLAEAFNNAENGESLLLNQDFKIEKTLLFQGNKTLSPKAQGKKESLRFHCGPGIKMSSGTLHIKGLHLTAKEDVLIELTGGHLILEDCRLICSAKAVVARGKKSKVSLRRCSVTFEGEAGFVISKGARAKFSEATIKTQQGRHGINLFESGPCSIDKTTISSSYDALVAHRTAETTVTNSRFLGCGDYGLHINYCPNFVATNCQIVFPGGIGVEISGGKTKLTKVSISRARSIGLSLRKGAEALFTECNVLRGQTGCNINESTCQFISCNFSHNSRCGLCTRSLKLVSFEKCRFEKNGRHGLLAEPNSHCQLKKCVFHENGHHGLRSRGKLRAFDCTFTKNKECGFYGSSDGRGKLVNCKIIGNGEHGIDLRGKTIYAITNCVVQENEEANLRSHDVAIVVCKNSSFNSSPNTGLYTSSPKRQRFFNCEVLNNKGQGIKVPLSRNWQMHNSLIEGSGTTGMFVKAGKLSIFKTTFHDNHRAHLSVGDAKVKAMECKFTCTKTGDGVNLFSTGHLELHGCSIENSNGQGLRSSGTVVATTSSFSNNVLNGMKIGQGGTIGFGLTLAKNGHYGISAFGSAKITLDKTCKFIDNKFGEAEVTQQAKLLR